MPQDFNCILYLALLPLATLGETPKSCKKIDWYYHLAEGWQDRCQRHENSKYHRNCKRFLTARATVTSEMSSDSGMHGLYRPRSALARMMYQKQINDRQLQDFDHNQWYQIDKTRLSPELEDKFVQLGPDEETKSFLSTSVDKSTWIWTQLWYLIAKAILKHFWSITDINGWLGRGSMFVLSEAQAKRLLTGTIGPHGDSHNGGALVDIGAGDGEVSRRFARLYQATYATEISDKMRQVLTQKRYTLLDTEDWWRSQQFECVCMMNLLDRCSRPITMLEQARAAIAPNGVLLLALVLPYKPYVEATPDHKPEESLPIEGVHFEDQVTSFVAFMRTRGFELVAWSRAPYLCEGDFAQAYYWLDDSVYVFKPVDVPTGNGNTVH